VSRSKDIGTRCETAVVRYLQASGWPSAERRALRGAADAGDITGTPGICWSVKGGTAARTASDTTVDRWLTELAGQCVHAAADVGVLVMQRAGYGPARAESWTAVMRLGTAAILHVALVNPAPETWTGGPPVRMLLGDAVRLLRTAGYGNPLEVNDGAA